MVWDSGGYATSRRSAFPSFFQLFDREAEADVTLRNTGNIGFQFCIVDPERLEEADEEAGDPGKAQEGLQEQPLPQEPSKHRVRRRTRPGQPTFIPDRVSPFGRVEGFFWGLLLRLPAVSRVT